MTKGIEMKKALKVTSVFCLLVAALAVIFGVIAMFSAKHSLFLGFAMFGVLSQGTFMGFIGNLVGILLTFASFGLMGFYTLTGKDKKAFIWSVVAVVLSIISLIIVIIGRKFTFGDLIITLLPIAHLFLIFKNTDA